jgi:hypothetical protein
MGAITKVMCDIKQRISVFCLMWGKKLFVIISFFLAAVLFAYAYTLSQHDEIALIGCALTYLGISIGVIVLLAMSVCAWRRRGQEKRRGSYEDTELSLPV